MHNFCPHSLFHMHFKQQQKQQQQQQQIKIKKNRCSFCHNHSGCSRWKERAEWIWISEISVLLFCTIDIATTIHTTHAILVQYSVYDSKGGCQ